MGYKLWENPSDIKGLTFQREKVISQINSSSVYKQRILQKVNHSYEQLKRELISPMEDVKRINSQKCGSSQIYQRDINNDLIRSVAICSDQNTTWQRDMEDSFTVIDNYGRRPNTCFVGVFDGCHGKSAACTVSTELPVLLLAQLLNVDSSYKINEEEKHLIDSFDTVFRDHYKETENVFSSTVCEKKLKGDVDLIHASYAKAFWRMDRILQLGREENSKVRWSGCTSVTCLIDGLTNTNQEEEELLAENKISTQTPTKRIGDIKAVLCRNGKKYCLTKKHSTSSSCERNRIIEFGGSISANEDWGLVEGVSKVTRGLGFHGSPKMKNSIIPAPHTISVSIDNSCQFLVLASSGLWDVLSESEVVAITMELLKSFKHPNNSKTEDTSNQNKKKSTLGDKNEMDLIKCNYDSINSVAHEILEDHDDEDCEVERPLALQTCHEMCSVRSDLVQTNSRRKYDNAAACVCQKLVKTAILAGSQQNVTACLILLPGCDELHYQSMVLPNNITSGKD
ncbi:protein phosphatase 2C-like domain-containing protein 1 [Rhinophrynus dorsalis]